MIIKIGMILLVVLSSLYSLVLNVVKYRSANNPTPENVADVFDATTYATWKKYSAEHCKLSIVSAIVSGVVTIALLATDVYAVFASLFPDGVFWQLLAVILLESVVSTIVSIIESYVATMKIEEKYGFNRSNMKTFVIDQIRGFIIGFVLSLGLAALIAALHQWLGDWMILLFVITVFCFTMLISFLYPLFSRIGNKFTPLEEGELKDNLMRLLTKHGYKVKAIEVMDASRRTTKLNAYFTGFGKMKTIVLYDNLLNAMTPDEICAAFAHELGHGLHKDVLKSQILNIGYISLIGVIAWFTVRTPILYTSFGFEAINYGFAYILIGTMLSFIQPPVSIVINARSRMAEYRADRQAVKEGYGEAMITAFKKLAKENFAHLAPSRLNVIMEYSHPPLSRRVEEVEKEMNKS